MITCPQFIDLADSLFFVARKKFGHLSPLHVIHHSTLPILCWWGPRWEENYFENYSLKNIYFSLNNLQNQMLKSFTLTMVILPLSTKLNVHVISDLLVAARAGLDHFWTPGCTWWCTSTTSWPPVDPACRSISGGRGDASDDNDDCDKMMILMILLMMMIFQIPDNYADGPVCPCLPACSPGKYYSNSTNVQNNQLYSISRCGSRA